MSECIREHGNERWKIFPFDLLFWSKKAKEERVKKKEPQRCTYYKVEKTAMWRKKISEMVNENSGDGKTGEKKKIRKASVVSMQT